MTVIGLRLITGEDILAADEGMDEGVDGIGYIKNPAIIMVTAGPAGTPNVGLADYMPFTDKKEMAISMDHVLFIYEPSIQLVNAYNTRFGSGLVTPQTGNIIPFAR